MGMPEIRSSNVTRSQAITDILQSIALEEAALAHILNAEGEKLQCAVSMDCITIDKLIEVNETVQSTMEAAAKFEQALQAKLSIVFKILYPPS